MGRMTNTENPKRCRRYALPAHSKMLASSSDHAIHGCLAAAHDQQREGHSQESHRQFHSLRRKKFWPEHTEDRREHYTRDQKGTETREQSEQHQGSANQFGNGGYSHPGGGRSHEGKWRGE